MKKLMIAALALTMIGGAAFAQKATPTTKQETKKEEKAGKHKKVHAKKAEKAEKMEKTEAAK
jgi:Ni/Co efflux regulator RcnB